MVLDIVDACIEVTEAIILFLSLLHAHMKHVEVEIHWSPVSSDSTQLPLPHSNSQTRTECSVQAHGLGAYFLDGEAFLQKLNTCCEGFKRFIDSQVWPAPFLPVQLVCRRIGDHSTMTCYNVQGVQNETHGLNIRERVEPTASHHLPTTSLSLTLTCRTQWEKVKEEMAHLSLHLHLLHIINPEVDMKLQLLTHEGEYQTCAEFHHEPFRSLLRTPFKLATSVCHYYHPVPLPEDGSGSGVRPGRRPGGKLRLVKGEKVPLPCCVQLGQINVPLDLQLCCLVALLPSMPVMSGKKTRADHCCTEVKLNMFGPAALPLLQADRHVASHVAAHVGAHVAAGLPHSLLADWEQYGMSLRAVAGSPEGVVPALQYRVLNRTPGAEDKKGVLQILLFVEHRGSGGQVIGENSHWAHQLALTHALRKELPSLLALHSAKFHRAIHTVLNKVLFNHTTQAELRSRLDRVIPVLAQAVHSIVSCSQNHQFRDQCSQVLQLGDSDLIQDTLTDKLWQLAGSNLDVEPPSSPPPSSQLLTPHQPSLSPHLPHPPAGLSQSQDPFEALDSAPNSPLEGEVPTEEATAEGKWDMTEDTNWGGDAVGVANMRDEGELMEAATFWDEEEEVTKLEDDAEEITKFAQQSQDTTAGEDEKTTDFENLETFVVSLESCDASLENISDGLTDITHQDLAWDN